MSGAVQALLGVLALTSSLASISGNLLLLLLFRREPAGVSCRGLALSATVSDLGLGLLATPLLAMALLGGATTRLSTASCQAGGFLLVLLLTASAHSQCLAACQRGAQLCLALRYSTVWTAGRRRAALLTAWLVAATWAILPLAGVGHYSHYNSAALPCGPSLTADGCGWVVAWLLVGGAAPVAAACLLAGRSIAVAWRQYRRGTFVCNHLHCYRVHSGRFLRSSVAMVTGPVCLLLCWLPFICLSLYKIFSGQQPSAHTEALSTWLLLSSASLNPWITCLTQTYRDALRNTFTRLRLLCPRRAVATEEEPCPQSSSLRLDTTNHVSAASTTAAAETQASASTKTLP